MSSLRVQQPRTGMGIGNRSGRGEQEYLEATDSRIAGLDPVRIQRLLAIGDVLSKFLPELPSFRHYQQCGQGGESGYLRHLRRHLNILTALQWWDNYAAHGIPIPNLSVPMVESLLSPLDLENHGEEDGRCRFEEALRIKEAIRTAIAGPGVVEDFVDDVIAYVYETTERGGRAETAVRLLDDWKIPAPGGKSWSQIYADGSPMLRSHLVTRYQRVTGAADRD